MPPRSSSNKVLLRWCSPLLSPCVAGASEIHFASVFKVEMSSLSSAYVCVDFDARETREEWGRLMLGTEIGTESKVR